MDSLSSCLTEVKDMEFISTRWLRYRDKSYVNPFKKRANAVRPYMKFVGVFYALHYNNSWL